MHSFQHGVSEHSYQVHTFLGALEGLFKVCLMLQSSGTVLKSREASGEALERLFRLNFELQKSATLFCKLMKAT